MQAETGLVKFQRVAGNVISWTGPLVVKVWISVAFLFR